MNLTITCICGASRQKVTSSRPYLLPSDAEMDRHGSGVLFVSHLAIDPPAQQKLSELSCYESEEGKRFFCGTCGCHVFKNLTDSPASGSPAQSPSGRQPPTELFAVATGVIIESSDNKEEALFVESPMDDTRDGGLGPWLPMAEMKGRTPRQDTEDPHESSYDSIPASCGCGNVNLLIQHPSELSDMVEKNQSGIQLPYSPYPDLMFPYKTTLKDKVDNPSDEKWYLQGTGEDSRYLAGTCACKSCRLSTGYEIQTWAFIPRVAIGISISPNSPTIREESNVSARGKTQKTESFVPLDFKELESLPGGRNPLRSYESSRGVLREFCHLCGATVFWHSQKRPDLIDVSVGLLRASEGARAEGLLQWWRDRCSFAEDAGLDREGWVKDWAEGLINGLEQGMMRQ